MGYKDREPCILRAVFSKSDQKCEGEKMIVLITPTGGRPEAFSVCQKLMERQTYSGPVTWVIIDDGPKRSPFNFSRENWHIVHIRPKDLWTEGQNTHSRNLLLGLECVDYEDKVLFIEDDDYYSPAWLAAMDKMLDYVALAGERNARYYNLKTGHGRDMKNDKHASLCSTGFRGQEALELFKEICRNNLTRLDVLLWRHFKGFKTLFFGGYVVGIKGFNGRAGIGVGHNQLGGKRESLFSLIGEDSLMYEPFRK